MPFHWPFEGQLKLGLKKGPLDAEAKCIRDPEPAGVQKMKILCHVDQAECFCRGIDAPSRTIKLEIDPSKIPANIRSFVAAKLYKGRKFGVCCYNGSEIEGGKDRELCLDQFRLCRPDVLGFFETVLTAMAYEARARNSNSDFNLWLRKLPQKKRKQFEGAAAELVNRVNQPVGACSAGKPDDETPTAKLVPLELSDVKLPDGILVPLKAFSNQNSSQRYDGCSITIQVPKDFYRQKDLLTIFDAAMPGLAVETRRRDGLRTPILFAVGIGGNGSVLRNAKETLKSFLAQK